MEYQNAARLEVQHVNGKYRVSLIFKQEEISPTHNPYALRLGTNGEISLGEYDNEDQVKDAVDLFTSALSETRIKIFRDPIQLDEGYSRSAETHYIHNTSVLRKW